MKKNKWGKAIVCTLAAGMLLAGCAKNETPQTEAVTDTGKTSDAGPDTGLYTEVGTYPIVNEPITMSVFASQAVNIIDFNTNEFTRYIEDMTGIDLEFQVAPQDAAKEKVNLLMTSGEMPEIFLVGNSGAVPDEIRFGVEEGNLIDLTALIDTQMPNFKKILDETPGLRGQITATDGKIYSLPFYNEAYHVTMSQKMWANTELLSEMGEEVPKTIDEFYSVCKKYKEMYPDGIAVCGGTFWNGDPTAFLSNPYLYHPGTGSPHGMVVKNGTVSTIADTEEYKEALRFMNRLYTEGLLYEGTFTMDATQAKALAASEGEPVLFMAGAASTSFVDSTANPELYRHYYPMEPLQGPEGENNTTYIPTTAAPAFAITTACEHPEAAARMVDYLYTLEGSMNAKSGVKGPGNWEDAKEGQVGLDGKPALYELIRPYSLEPQNETWQDAGVAYASSTFRFGEATDPDMDIYSPEGLELLLYRSTRDLYEPHKSSDVETLPTSLKLTLDESIGIQTKSVEVQNYFTQSKVQFITGALDLDKDWDTYVQGLDSMGMQDLIGVYQTAYDRQYK